jgi:hypothetical protein
MIIKILLVVAILAVIFVIIVASRPAAFRISRSVSISASPSVAFEQVNDLHKWQEMSPYAKMDLAATYTYEGPPAGPGASLSWTGNSKVGAGKMTITQSRPNELVRMRLEFLRPFRATNIAEFTFEAEAGQTAVTWSMSGKSNFAFKAVGLFMNCDDMVGRQFEEGLANLKAIAEGTNGRLKSLNVATAAARQ